MSNSNNLNFGYRTALITGGTKNIGLSIAKKLHAVGLNVAIVSSCNSNVDEALSHFMGSPRACGFVCDLRNTNEISNLITSVINKFNGIDIVVNSAGILDMASIEDTKEDIWEDVFSVNLKAPFFLIQKALPWLKKAEHPRIINISSNAGRMGGYANGLAYSASKGGLIAMTYGLARRLAPDRITVNCIAPGTIESDMSAARSVSTINELIKRFPLGRFGQADEVAAAVLYFASIDSGFTTGAVLDVNGGLFMG
jgi:3-oxoacyl-[acyl-carrier protein] reductase